MNKKKSYEERYIPPFKVNAKVFFDETSTEIVARFLTNVDNTATNLPDDWQEVVRYKVLCYNRNKI